VERKGQSPLGIAQKGKVVGRRISSGSGTIKRKQFRPGLNLRKRSKGTEVTRFPTRKML